MSGRMMWETYPVVWGLVGLLLVVGGCLVRGAGAAAPPGIRHAVHAGRMATARGGRAVRRRGGRRSLRQAVPLPAALVGRLLLVQHLRLDPRPQPVAAVRRHPGAPGRVLRPRQGPGELPAGRRLPRRRPPRRRDAGLHPDRDPGRTGRRQAGQRRGDPRRVAGDLQGLLLRQPHARRPRRSTPWPGTASCSGASSCRPTARPARSSPCVTGIPDVEVNETSSRNPLAVKQHTIINAFEGYEKLYFLGGSATWGNMRGLLSGNLGRAPALRGGELRGAAGRRLGHLGPQPLRGGQRARCDRSRTPFFAVIHTSGHHRPYTIPDDNRGFRDGAGRRGGAAPGGVRLAARAQRLPLPRPQPRVVLRAGPQRGATSPTPSSSCWATTACPGAPPTCPTAPPSWRWCASTCRC